MAECPDKNRILVAFGPNIVLRNVELAHLVLKCRALQAEALRRSVSARDPPRSGLQSIDNGLALGIMECGGRR